MFILGVTVAALGIVQLATHFHSWDSILTNSMTQMTIHLQALVRIFCGQFFYAFKRFDSSLDELLNMFGVSGTSLADLNWMDFRPNGTVLNAFAAFAMIGVFVSVLILVISLFKIALAPIVEAREKPLTVVVRFMIAMILIFYSPSIISVISDGAGVLNEQISNLATGYGKAVDENGDIFKQVTHYEQIEDVIGNSITENSETDGAPEGAPDANALQIAGEALVEIICNLVLMVEFLKLLSEICMREMVLLMLYMFFPTMAGTMVSRDTETIFKRYFQALIVQILLVSTSIIWYWMFMNLCSTMDFHTFGVVVGMLMEVGFVQMVKNVDNHLAQLGVSSAAVSGNLFDSIMGTIHTVTCSLSQIGRLAKGVDRAAGPAIQNAMNKIGGLGGNVPDKNGLPNKGQPVSVPPDKLRDAKPGSAAGEAVNAAMNSSDIFNGSMDHDQRDACIKNTFGEANLAKMAAENGIKTMPTEWTRNRDGSFTGHGAEFASGNKGDITLSSASKVAPGTTTGEKYDMANGRANEQFVVGAGGKVNQRDVSLAHAPQTNGEAVSQTGHTLGELKQNPGMAAGYMNSTESFMQNSVLGGKDDKDSIRSNMADSGISVKDGSMNSGRDGLVHGKANIGKAGEQSVVMGSESELRNAGYSNLATFKDADGNNLAMALAKDAPKGSLNTTENMTDAQAQILGGESAQQFKDNAINHADMYSNNATRRSDVSDSLDNSSVSGDAFKQSGIKIDVDSRGNITGQVEGGASYDFAKEGQVDLNTAEGMEDATDFIADDPAHHFVDSAGNKFSAEANFDGEAHGEAGVSYDFPDVSTEGDGSRNDAGNTIANDSFQNNVGSSAEDIRNGFGGYRDTNIAGMTIENNGAQTAYDSNGEVQGVRMANKATSTKGSPDYKYDLASSSGITDSAEAANQFGEPATTTDGGKTWQTQSGIRYERMSSANTNFYSRDSGRTKIVDGQDSQNRSYAYVSTEKPKGFSSSSRSQGDGRKERKSRRRSGAKK